MRLIDADALMAVMYHEAFETDSDRQKWDSGCWIRYKMFEEHIANAPTVGEWIPVSEKLPREGQKCLVCHKGAIGIDEFIGRDLPYKWRIYLRDYDAWMPLPEPYKESDTK